MNHLECQYYHGREDANGYCELNESSCLKEAFGEKCEEVEGEENESSN